MPQATRRADGRRSQTILRGVLSLLGFLIVTAAPFTAAAIPLFESAPNGPLASRHVDPSPYGDPPPVIAANQSLGVRFYVSTPVTVGSIGGFFSPYGSIASDIVGAIVRLDGSGDFPDSFDLTTDDVLGTTSIQVSKAPGNYAGDLALGLSGGWYALVFAATGTGDKNNALMHRMTADIGEPLYFFGRTAAPGARASTFSGFEYLDGGGMGGARMFVDENPAVPIAEPSTLLLLGIGVAGLGGALWVRRRPT